MTRFERTIKKSIFVVCEGPSELGYMRALNRFLFSMSPPCPAALLAKSVGGGSAASILEQGLKEIARRRRSGDRFGAIFALLDAQPDAAVSEQLAAARQKSEKAGLVLIWQPGSHEDFLLSHFPPRTKPKTIEEAWPGYRKGQDALFYEKKLTLEFYDTARKANTGFDALLSACDLPLYAAGA
jgi:hypothetical protein